MWSLSLYIQSRLYCIGLSGRKAPYQTDAPSDGPGSYLPFYSEPRSGPSAAAAGRAIVGLSPPGSATDVPTRARN